MDDDAHIQDDLELAVNIACGDEEAIRAFIGRYGPKLMGFLEREFERVWEDAWQETLIRLVNKIGQYDPDKASLGTWATKMAQNCAISILRAEKKYQCTEAHDDIETDLRRPPQENLTPKQRKRAEERAQQIREAIETLPPKAQRVVLADLAHPDGKSPADELAKAFETSTNAIDQARFRAKKKLREELERKGIYREERRQ